MFTLNTIQVILICIACVSFGFALGYVVKCTWMKWMKDNDTDKERN